MKGIYQEVHKRDISGRKVVSSVKYHTSNCSKCIDHYLQPHEKALSSYVQDTTDFMNKVETVNQMTPSYSLSM